MGACTRVNGERSRGARGRDEGITRLTCSRVATLPLTKIEPQTDIGGITWEDCLVGFNIFILFKGTERRNEENSTIRDV